MWHLTEPCRVMSSMKETTLGEVMRKTIEDTNCNFDVVLVYAMSTKKFFILYFKLTVFFLEHCHINFLWWRVNLLAKFHSARNFFPSEKLFLIWEI